MRNRRLTSGFWLLTSLFCVGCDTVEELLAQRIQALALGYEDLTDHAQLRRDPQASLRTRGPLRDTP